MVGSLSLPNGTINVFKLGRKKNLVKQQEEAPAPEIADCLGKLWNLFITGGFYEQFKQICLK